MADPGAEPIDTEDEGIRYDSRVGPAGDPRRHGQRRRPAERRDGKRAPQHPVHLGKHELRSLDVVQRPRRADEVERAALVRKRGRVRPDELDVRRRPLAALFE